jgi:hypothetical protein
MKMTQETEIVMTCFGDIELKPNTREHQQLIILLYELLELSGSINRNSVIWHEVRAAIAKAKA